LHKPLTMRPGFKTLRATGLRTFFRHSFSRYRPDLVRKTLDEAFQERFKIKLPEDELNAVHQIVVVAGSVGQQHRTHCAVPCGPGRSDKYRLFRVFADGDHQLLSRAWLLDPVGADESGRKPAGARTKWNGEYYGFVRARRRTLTGTMQSATVSSLRAAGGGSPTRSHYSFLVVKCGSTVPGRGYVGACEVEKPCCED